ncbi:hypothetical protein C8Q76DRAFT_792156 [Earliella scabrosa]|nr:hypothetical protein C8Q76DRAFT_801443 [Earliella scabrosa]KAI0735623.1 hypothetical protein C8Q76DRAFT_792156 [Earliella scabrosa]
MSHQADDTEHEMMEHREADQITVLRLQRLRTSIRIQRLDEELKLLEENVRRTQRWLSLQRVVLAQLRREIGE